PCESESYTIPIHVFDARSLADSVIKAEIEPRPTDFGLAQAARAKSVRLESAPIGFARGVHEMTVHPRPASPEGPATVETDHPHGGSGHVTLWSCAVQYPRQHGNDQTHSRRVSAAP